MKAQLLPARFISRKNRFVAEVEYKGEIVTVYVPNTGRLGELLLPGIEVLLEPSPGKYVYRLTHVFFNGYLVMIESARTNRIIEQLLIDQKVPGYEDCSILRREPSHGNHRFDFLLQNSADESFFLEVKSCTLAWKSIASFPDAISERARSHLEVLAKREDSRAMFVIFNPGIDRFVPNFHTDYGFYRELKKASARIAIDCFRVKQEGLDVTGLTPVPLIIPEIDDRGILVHLAANEKSFALVFEIVRENMSLNEKRAATFIITSQQYKSRRRFPIRGSFDSAEMAQSPLSALPGQCGHGSVDDEQFWQLFENDPTTTAEFWDALLAERFSRFSGKE